ncbi:MAG: hypothetical protein ABIO72_03050 [Patescibacteria group bacterium]
MNRRQTSTLLVLQELGITSNMDAFDERLSVQKSIYLAQAAGVELGHYFSWYLRGPYAPSVAQDVFDAIQNDDHRSSLEGWELDPASRAKLATIRLHFGPPASLTQGRWLELLASIHFLIARNQVKTQDPVALRSLLARHGKTYTADQVASAISVLHAANLIARAA